MIERKYSLHSIASSGIFQPINNQITTHLQNTSMKSASLFMTPPPLRAFVMKTFKLPLSTLAIFAMAASAQAAVLLDFQFTDGPLQTGAAVVGSTGDYWNNTNVAVGTTSNRTLALLNIDGTTASGVSLTWSAGSAVSHKNDAGNGFIGTAYQNLMTGHIDTLGFTASTLALTGLNAALTYNIYLYTQPNAWWTGDGTGRKIAFSTSGLITTPTQTTLASDPSIAVFTLGTNYVEFLNVAPDSGGNLTINYV